MPMRVSYILCNHTIICVLKLCNTKLLELKNKNISFNAVGVDVVVDALLNDVLMVRLRFGLPFPAKNKNKKTDQ